MTAGVSSFGFYYTPGEASADPTPRLDFYNNIISWEVTGISSWTNVPYAVSAEFRNQDAYIYNNTIIGVWGVGIYGDNNGDRLHYVRNNLISGAAVATTENASRCDYNATNLSSLGYTASAHDRVSQTFSFVSSTDHALTGADTGAKGYGASDPGSGLFSDDINGTTRTGSWDIGAFEYTDSSKFFMFMR